jgi:hypothetical protein
MLCCHFVSICYALDLWLVAKEPNIEVISPCYLVEKGKKSNIFFIVNVIDQQRMPI